jgi:hypothetical protein
MAIKNHPKPGQIWLSGCTARKVVSVFDSTEGIRVVWQKPDSDWVTTYVQLKSWLRWAAGAELNMIRAHSPFPRRSQGGV